MLICSRFRWPAPCGQSFSKKEGIWEMKFRFASEGDCGLILPFIRQLANYENMSDQVVATAELLREGIWKSTAEKTGAASQTGSNAANGLAIYCSVSNFFSFSNTIFLDAGKTDVFCTIINASFDRKNFFPCHYLAFKQTLGCTKYTDPFPIPENKTKRRRRSPGKPYFGISYTLLNPPMPSP